MNIIKVRVFLFIFIGFLVTFSSSSSYAQEMCNLVKLKVGKIKGKVVTNDDELYPFSSSQVKLFKVNNRDVLISSTITDKNGFFEIENIDKGEYRLVVWATTEKGLTLFTYDVIIRVDKNNIDKETNQLIYVKLGGDCFDSDAKLIDEKACPDSQ